MQKNARELAKRRAYTAPGGSREDQTSPTSNSFARKPECDTLRRFLRLTCSVFGLSVLFVATASAQTTYAAFTYIGGSAFDRAQGCAFDNQGFVWVTGNSTSTDLVSSNLPASVPSFDRSHNGSADAFVAKFTPDLSDLIYATYIGGQGDDRGYQVILDDDGYVYVVGISTSADFPTTPGAFQMDLRGDADVFIAKFEPDLSDTVFVTLLGGASSGTTFDSDWTRGAIEFDSAGNIIVAGKTAGSGFPTTTGAFQENYQGGDHDAFVTKLSADGSNIIWSTYVGGSGGESFYGNLEVHPDDSITVAGYSNSSNFPTTPGAFEENYSGRSYPVHPDFPNQMTSGDGVVVHLTADGAQMIYGTYLWGNVAGNDGLAIDRQGRANMIIGVKNGVQGDVVVTPNALQSSYGGGSSDGSVARLSADGRTIEASTFVGGSGDEEISGIDVDTAGNFYIGGNNDSSDYPVTSDAAQLTRSGDRDAVLTILASDASLIYSTYLGGPERDRGRCIEHKSDGTVLLTGDTGGSMPQAGTPFDSSYNGGTDDGFIAIFVPEPSRTGLTATALLVLLLLLVLLELRRRLQRSESTVSQA